MELKNQLTSLNLSKRLKELGVKQDSEYYHQHTETLGIFSAKTEEERNKFQKDEIVFRCNISDMAQELYSAFSVAELGEMLSSYVETWKMGKLDKKREGLFCCSDVKYHGREEFVEKKEADARSKMLIYLLENKLIEV